MATRAKAKPAAKKTSASRKFNLTARQLYVLSILLFLGSSIAEKVKIPLANHLLALAGFVVFVLAVRKHWKSR